MAVRRIFISYQRQPSLQLARLIERELRANQYDVFLDKNSIPYVSEFPQNIKNGIQRCDVVIVLLASSTPNSEWVRKELALATKLNKPIIPVLQDGFSFTRRHPPMIAELATINSLLYDSQQAQQLDGYEDVFFHQLEKVLGNVPTQSNTSRAVGIGMGIILMLLVIAGAVFVLTNGSNNDTLTEIPTEVLTTTPTETPTPTETQTESPT